MVVRRIPFIFTVFVIMILGLAISCTSIEKVETVEKVAAEEKAEATEEAAKETTTTVEEVSGQ